MKLLRRYHEKIIAVVLGAAFVFFAGCAADLDEKNGSAHGFGSVTVSASGSRQLDVESISKARVSVSGYKMETKSVETAVSGGKGSVTVEQIPAGKNRVVTVQAFGGETKLDGVVMRATADITAGANTSVSVDWESSKKGAVYNALLESGVDIGNLTDGQAARIEAAIPDIHASLINAAAIAADFDGGNGTLKGKDEYKLSAGTVNMTVNGFAGCTVQITDPTSAVSNALSSDSGTVSISNVAPGTWLIYVLDGTEKKHTRNITIAGGEKKDVVIGTKPFDGIQIQVAKSLGYPLIHYWDCSDKAAYPNTAWPGIKMDDGWCDDDYIFNFEDCSSVSLLITNSSKEKLCNTDVVISEKGSYRITSSGKVASVYIPQKSAEPLPPTVQVPSKAYLGRTFAITVTSDSELIFSTVAIGGIQKTLAVGTNTFSVADFASAPTTISVTGTVANEAGSVPVNKTIIIEESVVSSVVSDPNELRIYQVMVASFQDGDPSIGYTQMWGPDNQTKGGDLQGIINAVPYIRDLGCNALWMTPIFNSNGDSKLDATGYFAYDYFNVDPRFGTNEKFAELVELCHSEGISIILDGVFGHNKGTVAQSPSRRGIKNPGITPDTANPVNYATNPNSLKYYSDVASYWITEYKIDGWRLDQCYQVAFGENAKGTVADNCNTGGHNYWYDIRKVVENAAASNGTRGQDWGTLGYMVGEHWRGDASLIQNGSVAAGTAAGYGLNSCFDFPAYYQLVQGFAQEWDGKSTGNIGAALAYTYKTFTEKGYECRDDDGSYDTYYPNLMLTNHDLFRIGDLINKKYSVGFDSDAYIRRNKVLIAAQCAYSGPITIYYGDEIGDHNATTTSGWGSDNVARSSGKIAGFNSREQQIHDWTAKCLASRAAHEALWCGTNEEVTNTSSFYAAKKSGGGETVYIAFNNGSSAQSFAISGSGEDLLSGETFSGSVSVPALSARYVLIK